LRVDFDAGSVSEHVADIATEREGRRERTTIRQTKNVRTRKELTNLVPSVFAALEDALR
jgi:hypothetical protein